MGKQWPTGGYQPQPGPHERALFFKSTVYCPFSVERFAEEMLLRRTNGCVVELSLILLIIIIILKYRDRSLDELIVQKEASGSNQFHSNKAFDCFCEDVPVATVLNISSVFTVGERNEGTKKTWSIGHRSKIMSKILRSSEASRSCFKVFKFEMTIQ